MATLTFYTSLFIIRFLFEVICMCFAEDVFFARLGVRSGVPQRRDFARRAAQRRVQWIWYVHNVFTEPTGRKCVPARANRRRTRDIAPARLRHAYRVHVKSRPALLVKYRADIFVIFINNMLRIFNISKIPSNDIYLRTR